MSIDLQVLVDNRDAILLAEVAAWLHMFGKFHEDFLGGNHDLDIQIPQDLTNDYPALDRLLRDDWSGLLWKQIPVTEFASTNLSFFTLVGEHRNLQKAVTGLSRLMADAHGRGSGIEKGVLNRFAPGQANKVYAATAVGFEADPINLATLTTTRKNLYDLLQTLLQDLQTDNAKMDWASFRQKLIPQLQQAFRSSVAETRRPLNDVTLFDQTTASVALFKAAVAQNLLNGWKEPKQNSVADKYHWQILRVGFDALQYFGQAARMSDVLSRKEQCRLALDKVKALLEETYPVGAEIYRDENGSLFATPDVDDLLRATTTNGSLSDQLQKIADAAFSGEARFSLEVSKRTRNMLRFGKLATGKLPLPTPHTEWVQAQWGKNKHDICPVCTLRPQGPSNKAIERKICDVCEKRRANRAQAWTNELSTTIWTDEVADDKGRLALIVGQFELETWLTGQAFHTMLTFDPATRTLTDPERNNKSYEFNYPKLVQDTQEAIRTKIIKGKSLLDNLVLTVARDGSFENFYKAQVSDTDLGEGRTTKDSTLLALAILRQNPSFARIRRVWETTRTFWQQTSDNASSILPTQIRLAIHPQTPNSLNLGPFHTYELVLNGVRLSVVWDAPGQRLITCDNLDYLAKPEQLGKPVVEIITLGKTLTLEEPAGYGSTSTQVSKITIAKVESLAESYAPTIPILAEPRTFMALVPADKALDVIDAIKTKYEREMGKVRNRLPLHLGVVYFGRRTPLAAALDAGRRMLKRPARTIPAAVKTVTPNQPAADGWPQSVTVTLEIGDRRIAPTIPTVMGDGATPDLWYPYWQVANKPSDRTRWFAGADGEHWVHVCDLRPGDSVSFTPSTFDFEWLDTSARRFEVAYTPDGQRRGSDKAQRPYLLEEIPQLAQAWQGIRGLATSQIKTVEATLEGKRRDWQEPNGRDAVSPTFQQFIADLLRTAGGADVYCDSLAQAARTGLLADALELYLTINKADNKTALHKEAK